MTTQSRIEANRRNAQMSTGPRTPEGKARVAHNAIKHGILCDQAVLSTEDRGAFEEFRDALVGDLSPLGAMEQVLAERIVAATWRLRRVLYHETCLQDRDEGRSLYQEHQMHLVDERPAGARVHPSAMGEALKESFGAPHSAYDTLRRYERSIQHELTVCVHELEERQGDRMRLDGRKKRAAGTIAELAAALRAAEEETATTENTEGTEGERIRRGDAERGDAEARKEIAAATFSREPEASACLTKTEVAESRGESPEAPATNRQSSIGNGQSPVGFVSQERDPASPGGFAGQDWRGRGPRMPGDFIGEDGILRDVTGVAIPLEGQNPKGEEKNAQ